MQQDRALLFLSIRHACVLNQHAYFSFSITHKRVKSTRTTAHKSYHAACQIDTQIFTVTTMIEISEPDPSNQKISKKNPMQKLCSTTQQRCFSIYLYL
jgi:hypothetical protein